MESYNVVILRGTVRAAPTHRVLPSGATVHELDVRVVVDDAASIVPVSSFAAGDAVASLEPGAEVVVVGSVRRRFFRSGDATVGRTDVVAEQVIPARRRRAVGRALAGALAQIHDSQ